MSMLCGNCFQQVDADDAVHCPFCGHVLLNPSGTLPVGSILHGKYIVGSVVGQGSVGITYKGIVYQSREAVFVLEYFPQGLVRRRSNGVSVAALQGCEGAFEGGRNQFGTATSGQADCGAVSGLGSMSDRFVENGTSYVIAADAEQPSQQTAIAAQGAAASPVPVQDQSPVSAEGQPVAAAPVASPAASANGERIRDDWSPIVVWLLSVITFGIYGLYFYHHVAKGLNAMCWEDQKRTSGVGALIGLTIVTFGIYGYYWLYAVGERIRSNAPRFGAQVTSGGGVLVGCALGVIGSTLLFAGLLGSPLLGSLVNIGLSFLLCYYLATSYAELARAYNARM